VFEGFCKKTTGRALAMIDMALVRREALRRPRRQSNFLARALSHAGWIQKPLGLQTVHYFDIPSTWGISRPGC
jgi:hypothetical protein